MEENVGADSGAEMFNDERLRISGVHEQVDAAM